MKLSRRQFIGLAAGASLAGCARTRFKDIANLGVGDGTFTFAAIGDLHVLDAKSTAIVNRAAQSINANKSVAFTVVLGDLATDGKYGELNMAKASLARLERPHFVVPGNHDVDPTQPADDLENFRTLYRWKNWENDSRGWVLMGIDSCDGTKSDVSIREEQIEWIAKRLESINPSRPIAVMVHHPFNPNSKAYRVQNADDVLALFSGHNLKLVAAGHYHGNQEETRDGVLFTTTACCSTTRPNFDGTEAKGYRLFRVAENEITTEFVEV